MNQFNLFSEYNIQDCFDSSKEIINKAIKDYNPYKICVMFSGGDDSLTALYVALELGIEIDYLIHGKTGTGVFETFDFVKMIKKNTGLDLIISEDKGKYIKRVKEKGFYGNGKKAHQMSYNDLKGKPFNKAISKNIRKRKHNRKILLINGARRNESVIRSKTCKIPYNIDGSNIWVNIINDWSKDDCIEFLESKGIERNPVSLCINRSGECNCGTTAKRWELNELKQHFNKTYEFLISLENQALKDGFFWRWSEKNPTSNNYKNKELFGQQNLFMCSGCEFKMQKKKS